MNGIYHRIEEFCNIDMTRTFQFKLYKEIKADTKEAGHYSIEIKENALRTVLTYIIDNNKDIDYLECFLGPNLYKHVSESFLREFKDYIDWERAQIFFKFSEDFIKYEIPIKNWDSISLYQNLSEKFIEEFRDRIDWDHVSRVQKLSYPFLKKHHKEVNWEIVEIYQESWFNRINNLD